MITDADPKPKSMINGKRNPEYQKWWVRNNPEKVAALTKRHNQKAAGAKNKKRLSVRGNGPRRKLVISMAKDGWSHSAIAVTLRVPMSRIEQILAEQTKP